MKTAATSVPIASDPLPIIWPPTQSTAVIATIPRNSMPGKKREFSHWACVFVLRFASLPASNSPRNASSRL